MTRAPARGGILGWLLGGLIVATALAVLGWMLLLPGTVRHRFAALTGGAELALQGLMGDPFNGRATVTGWTLRASSAPEAVLLAEGGPGEVVASGWQAAVNARPGSRLVLDSARLHVTRLVLAPDASGQWTLLALAAAAGLPYDREGTIGAEAARVSIRKLSLSVESVVVRDAATARDIAVRIDWHGEFRDLDHSRPLVAALLAAVAAQNAAP